MFREFTLCDNSATESKNSSFFMMLQLRYSLSHSLQVSSRPIMPSTGTAMYTVSQKTVQNGFCQNFVKFPTILTIFGRKIVKRRKLCEVHSFSTWPNSRHQSPHYTVSQKTVQICFCQNFVKFQPISIIFGRKTAKRPQLCEMHSFSISSNSCDHTSVLNADVPNC